MRKEDVEVLSRRRPFVPFEIRLVDGERWKFTSPEQLIVSRGSIYTLDRKGDGHFISVDLISKIRTLSG